MWSGMLAPQDRTTEQREHKPTMEMAPDALSDPKSFYDARYANGYMQGFNDLYEVCRVYTVRAVLERLKRRGFSPRSTLDYGCGEGRYIGVLSQLFPKATFYGCDISDIGLDIARSHYPMAEFRSMRDEVAPFDDARFDLLISVEVLEHVQDVHKASQEIGRVLRPGGLALITTPCANRYSFEWFRNRKNGLQPSPDGYGRFATDEPGHVRRLNDQHIRRLLSAANVQTDKIFHRTHLFTSLMEFQRIARRVPMRLRKEIALLDWHLFKHLPNGATMLVVGRKPTSYLPA
jgi:SAM-dependent methyltransferase